MLWERMSPFLGERQVTSGVWSWKEQDVHPGPPGAAPRAAFDVLW